MADMSSKDAYFGLEPYGEILGCNMYAIVTATTPAFYHGDLVEQGGASLETPAMGALQQCVVEAEGAAGSILGVVVGLFDEDMTPVTYIAASEAGNGTIAGYALVADVPAQKYIIQEDGAASSLQAADIGLNVDCVVTHAGDTTTGISGMEIDSSSKATTVSLALKLLGVHPEDSISTTGTAGNHCRFIVMVNSAANAPNVVGA